MKNGQVMVSVSDLQFALADDFNQGIAKFKEKHTNWATEQDFLDGMETYYKVVLDVLSELKESARLRFRESL